MTDIDLEALDKGIKSAVILLRRYGYKTYESCQGGEGHAYPEPTVRFYGDSHDLIRAYEICKVNALPVYEAKMVYNREPIYAQSECSHLLGETWDKPCCELTFLAC